MEVATELAAEAAGLVQEINRRREQGVARSGNASLLGSGLERKYAVLAQGLAMKANGLSSQDPVVPVAMAVPYMPTPRFRRIGVISWSV